MKLYKIAHKYPNPISWSKEIWNLIYKKMKATGFAFTSAEDTKNSFFRVLKRAPTFLDEEDIFPEWHEAIKSAFSSQSSRITNLETKKEEQGKYKSINWSRIRQLGKTEDFKEAGYIDLNGALIDLSGKRERFPAGQRSLDHREAGDTEGMQELMMYGYIRMDYRAGNLDIAKEPTAKQYETISKFIYSCPTDYFYIDLTNGFINDVPGTSMKYTRSRNSTSLQVENSGVHKREIIPKIRKFFSGIK